MHGDAASNWRHVDLVLDAALDLPHDQRASFLDRACTDDPALRADAERLLQACDRAEHFLDEPALLFASPLLESLTIEAGAAPDVGMHVGPYRLIRELGHGGMGAVYLAERDDSQFRHRVALKVIRRGMDDDAVLRFMDERQILASLNHPNIARLLDGGVTSDGLPYFAMEYVEGLRIDRYCDGRRLSIAARLELFVHVCHGVQYAHRNLIVHRDLKPSNILVTDDEQVKLLDFGIAKLLGAPEAARALTQGGARLMTPQYASPEQVRGESISTASDIYTLGVVLYELLTGQYPYRCAAHRDDLERAVLNEQPIRPSTAVRRTPVSRAADRAVASSPSASDARNCTVEKLHRTLRGDLDTIVLRAMSKEIDRRYGTAEQLASDIWRHLAGRPVTARRDTFQYRAQKFVRRHPFSVAAMVAFTTLLVVFSSVTTIQSRRIGAQAEHLKAERDKAQQITSFLTEMFNLSSPLEGKGNTLRARDVLDSATARIDRELKAQPEIQAQLMKRVGRAYYGLGLYGSARRLYTSALVLFEQTQGENSADASSTMNGLALVLLDDGDYQAAERMYRRALAIRRRMLGDQHRDVARTLNGLGLVLCINGRGKDADAVLREALNIDRRTPENLVGIGQTLNNLGRVRQDAGDAPSAEALHRESLALRTRLFGADHFEVSVSQVNLAIALRTRGELATAESLLRQALRTQRLVLSDEHADVAATMSELAAVVAMEGDARAAEALYRESLQRQRRVLGSSHPRLIGTLVRLGQLVIDKNRPAEGERLIREALAISEQSFPADHWQIGEAQVALGAALSALGDDNEAERLLVSGYTTLEQSRGTQHRQTQVARASLAAHYERSGRASEVIARLIRGGNEGDPR